MASDVPGRGGGAAEGGGGRAAQVSLRPGKGPACPQPTAEMSLTVSSLAERSAYRGEAQPGKPRTLLEWDFRRILCMRKGSGTPARPLHGEGKDATPARQGGNPKSTII